MPQFPNGVTRNVGNNPLFLDFKEVFYSDRHYGRGRQERPSPA
jgi:hypothetical protein